MTKFTGRYADDKWVESFNKWMSSRITSGGGCISERACDQCRAIHTDSLCLCIGAFVCSECGFDNGQKYKEMYKSFETLELPKDYFFKGN